jgi:predicted glycosyltransferase
MSRDVTLRDILDLFTNDYKENDDVVTAFVNGFYDSNTVVRDPKFF